MQHPQLPEVLAPAGSRESLRAALAAGADAVYFGLDEGFNARARAANFPLEGLAETVAEIHAAGARAYLTLNTLIFQSELAAVERILRAASQARVDALIIQDPAVALLSRRLGSPVALHASTQMTISSPEAAQFASGLGITRVVLPRELSLQEIAAFRKACSLETEVFIAGALCMAWSGQCLSSEVWGGRSANRGQCAQACRLPYDLEVDGERRELGNVAYLLSPQDLAGYRAARELAELGVRTLKIEGRQKDASYVFSAVRAVKSWLAGAPEEMHDALRDLALAYSRGLSDGFFDGGNHQTLVDGRSPRHRGIRLGRVTAVRGRQLCVRPETPIHEQEPARSPLATPPIEVKSEPRPGMGLVILSGQRQLQEDEIGGPIFAVESQQGDWWLDMGARGPRLDRVAEGDEVYLTSDPAIDKRVRQALNSPLEGRLAARLRLSGQLGQPLRACLSCQDISVNATTQQDLAAALQGQLDEALVRSKMSLGGTPFCLSEVDCGDLQEGLFLPVSQLKSLRRELVEKLNAAWSQRPLPELPEQPVWPQLLPPAEALPARSTISRLVPLVRNDEQLEGVIEAGFDEVILDWMELVGLRHAFARARSAGLKVGVATVRIQKPQEEGYDRRLAALEPDSVLVRHWAGVMEFSRRPRGPRIDGDFSLNVSNAVTAQHLLELGLDSVTAAHDLDRRQLDELLTAFPAARLAVTVHHHIPTFHTEHCVYSHLLSQGRDYRSCGRPCEQHRVGLTDRKGVTHPVIVDVGCRNTVFNGKAHSALTLLEHFKQVGVATLRLEFVWEDRQQTRQVLETYRDVLQGRLDAATALARIGASEQFGVSLGTMQVLT